MSEKNLYNILVIDNSVFMAKHLSQILVQGGFEVAATVNMGITGYNKYLELFPNIDLVALDVTMPNMDGFSTLKRLVELDRNAKVIMVVDADMEDLGTKCLGLGARSFIKKPFDKGEVLRRVTSVLKPPSLPKLSAQQYLPA